MRRSDERLIVEHPRLDVDQARMLWGCPEERRPAIEAKITCQFISAVGMFGERTDPTLDHTKLVVPEGDRDAERATSGFSAVLAMAIASRPDGLAA